MDIVSETEKDGASLQNAAGVSPTWRGMPPRMEGEAGDKIGPFHHCRDKQGRIGV